MNFNTRISAGHIGTKLLDYGSCLIAKLNNRMYQVPNLALHRKLGRYRHKAKKVHVGVRANNQAGFKAKNVKQVFEAN